MRPVLPGKTAPAATIALPNDGSALFGESRVQTYPTTKHAGRCLSHIMLQHIAALAVGSAS